ncbi:MAG TPA: polyprenyl diphosphate synthase [Candidatus Atribacteria bacterium]|jgi:undecaprenyl diphosphate synthase|uniref:polyprenyl diphosphate synthase n=1 Tax=Candidatus Sordicultor fermentans TaxID=1953203 RepID=UPI002A300196|nr:polyprenyl diphosphate synthase [Atribacterota bacterium]HOA98425.1 polyprenyl diphosphate synthase [Candidatus Atribacteria bacterium]MDI9607943.1 polyprenyl diphosphate synthase [Atribacterota bacterium]MDY0134301.1 polyprenyl diphosphate synthase [Atribacterota bacterium]HOQ50289.1 polyprenyl diphosphate synthase [Candidatus Atribacteria bacterium]
MGKERKRNNDYIGTILRHVAIIMDGNGRWAEKRGLPPLEGHRKGVEVVRILVEETAKVGISFLTLYAFSTENWKRPVNEIQGLMRLFVESMDKYGKELEDNKVRVKFLGRKDGLPEDLVLQMNDLEKHTMRGENLNLNLAINYGGRDEILRAVKNIYQENHSLLASLLEENFSAYLDTGNQPDPDLLIRTGGERRISNFLLWQIAYTELWFTDTLWPDFTIEEYHQAFQDFMERERKFGGRF